MTSNSPFACVPEAIVEALRSQGICEPTPIQSEAIPLALAGRDLMVMSPTGSGKTLAFAAPIVAKLMGNVTGNPQALVLTPTRELATQVAKVFSSHFAHLGVRATAITGGASFVQQRKLLKSGTDVVVGTPGRVLDLLRQRILQLNTVSVLVLDEVDQMLEVGFADDLKAIRAELPKSQTLFFSATLGPRIRSVAKTLLKPDHAVLGAVGGIVVDSAPSTIAHAYMECLDGKELPALVNGLLFHNPKQGLIFCDTRQECADVAEALVIRGFNAAALHGDLDQPQRDATLGKFRAGRIRYLVATNVAARGLHVDDLPLVVNFRVPRSLESYTHRVGRTGRAGASGIAWSLVTPRSARTYMRLMHEGRFVPVQERVPEAAEIAKAHLGMLLEDLAAETTESTGTRATLAKNVERTVGGLDADCKDRLLRHLLLSRLENLGVHYTSGLVPEKACVRQGGGGDRPVREYDGERRFDRRSQRPWSREGRSFGGGRPDGQGRSAGASARGPASSSARGPASGKAPYRKVQPGGDARKFRPAGQGDTAI